MIGVTPKGVEIAAWIVKANPATFDVGEDLSKAHLGEEWDWTLAASYRLDLMKPGQPCFLWVTQNRNPALVSGIWITAELTGEPRVREGVSNTMWRDVAKGEKRSPVVPMRIQTLRQPVTRDQLLAHPVLRELEVFTSPQMSNPQIVTPEQLAALRDDFDLTPTELDAVTRWSLLEGDLLVDAVAEGDEVVQYYETSSGRCFDPEDPSRSVLGDWTDAVRAAAGRSVEDPAEVLGGGVDVLAVYAGGQPVVTVRTAGPGRVTVVELGDDEERSWADDYPTVSEAAEDVIAHLEVWLETAEQTEGGDDEDDAEQTDGGEEVDDAAQEVVVAPQPPTTDSDGRPGKYDPLRDHLAAIAADQSFVTMTFVEVDKLVGGLPASARTIPQWWANDSKVEARAWRAAGWHVDSKGVDFNAGTVRFARGRVGGSRARRLGLET